LIGAMQDIGLEIQADGMIRISKTRRLASKDIVKRSPEGILSGVKGFWGRAKLFPKAVKKV